MRLVGGGSYGASVQAQQFIMLRTMQALMRQGDRERAVNVVDRFFEAFPHMNFPYNYRTIIYINFYVQAEEYDKAKEHLRILANELAQWMVFFDSISDDDLEAGFKQDYGATVQGIQEILRLSKQVNDDAFVQEMENVVGAYSLKNLQN